MRFKKIYYYLLIFFILYGSLRGEVSFSKKSKILFMVGTITTLVVLYNIFFQRLSFNPKNNATVKKPDHSKVKIESKPIKNTIMNQTNQLPTEQKTTNISVRQHTYLELINKQYSDLFFNLRTLINVSDGEWSDFYNNLQHQKSENLNLLKDPLENYSCDSEIPENLMKIIQKWLNVAGISPKAIHYKLLDINDPDNESTDAFISRNTTDGSIVINVRKDTKAVDIIHEIGHILSQENLEGNITSNFFQTKNVGWQTLYGSIQWTNLRRMRETRADRRIAIFDKKACAILVGALSIDVINWIQFKIQDNTYNAFSPIRIPQYQQFIHALDLWKNVYQEPVENIFDLVGENFKLEKNDYTLFINHLHKKADDTTWDIKRIIL